ncbi:MAG: hypothetical protein M1817_002929 [Caeruleum heppii]|nr:MAG: hypothetical protein M1817_002929 [Caeruleum heppii]
MDPSVTPSKQSSLPRPSKLPVSRLPQPPSLRGAPASQSQRYDVLPPRQSLRSTASVDSFNLPSASGKSHGQLFHQSGPHALRSSKVTRHTDGPGNNRLKEAPTDRVNDAPFKRPFARPLSRHQDVSRPPSRLQHDELLEEKEDEPDTTIAGRKDEKKLDETPKPKMARKPRPSLSDRTLETLAQLPPSPSPRRRRSSFFYTESPMRPASAIGQRTRPGSQLGHRPPVLGADHEATTSARRGSPSKRETRLEGLNESGSQRLSVDSSRSTSAVQFPKSVDGNPRRVASKPAISRRSPANARHQASTGSPKLPPKTNLARTPLKISSVARPKTAETDPFRASLSSVDANVVVGKAGLGQGTPPKTSQSLRETIAKAKATKRQTQQAVSSWSKPELETTPVPATKTNPINDSLSVVDLEGRQTRLQQRITIARTSGRLVVSGIGLSEIPQAVMSMYDLESANASGVAWYESVDLAHFCAADNELESIGTDVFPDVESGQDSEDENGNMFAGLETLSLKGNILSSVPIGLRQLRLLVVLDLSNNRLEEKCFDVIGQCHGLRELRMGGNCFKDAIPGGLANLVQLEVFEIQENQIISCSNALDGLSRLRKLNLSGNRLTSIPGSALARMPLSELFVSRNRLNEALFSSEIRGLEHLKILDAAQNNLGRLTDQNFLSLPALEYLDISANRIETLPTMSSWQQLLRLNVAHNQLAEIPQGFTSLKAIKHANLGSNQLRTLDDRIGLMIGLTSLGLQNNPLRQRRLLNMSTEDLKSELCQRLEAEGI